MGEQKVSTSRVIPASASEIFDLLRTPSRHALIDGSGTVQQSRGEEQKLELGSQFGMDMKFGPASYRTYNTVKEYEKDRLIAWSHAFRHRWRYELEPVDDNTTEVTETFDYSYAPLPIALELLGYPKKNLEGMKKTLERMERHFSGAN